MTVNPMDTKKETNHFLGVFIGDSLMNAYYKVGVNLEDTYLYMLEMLWRENYSVTYTQSVRMPGTPLKQIFDSANNWFIPSIGPRKIDVCIINCGIVDCAPRMLPNLLYHALNYVPTPIRDRIIKILHDNRPKLQKALSFRFTPPNKFSQIYSNLLQLLSSQSVRTYVVNIAPSKVAVYEHSPGLEDSIIKYNEIIRNTATKFENVILINVFDEFQNNPERYLTSDLHITKDGHQYIYSQISKLESTASK